MVVEQMYVHVSLLNGFSQKLWYAVPSSLRVELKVGSVVQVPLQKRVEHAVVVKIQTERPAGVSFEIKEVLGHDVLPADEHYFSFIKQVSYAYQYPETQFIKRVRHFLDQKKEMELCEQEKDEQPHTQQMFLTDEQQKVCSYVSPYIQQGIYQPVVLHGVTGSGKTHVYKELIMQAFLAHKTTVLLLPEVRLAIHFQQQLRHLLPSDIEIYGFHSGSSPQEKRALWMGLLAQKALLIIGVHLPIMLPISNLGLIAVDEEHDHNYQEKKHPRIHTREVALLRARLYGIPILLGSATPSITTLFRTRKYRWPFFQLTKRFSGAMPVVRTVSLTVQKERPHFWISMDLKKEISARLARKEQVIIFLNRRGYSFFVQCSVCSLIFSCNNCSVSLTLHEDSRLMCHYCGVTVQMPNHCIGCQAHQDLFIKKGIGTQQAVSTLKLLFPHASIARADMDSAARKKEWQQTVSDFKQGKIDILVGTQTIAKGFHFPRVTLIGIIWADLNLNFPVFYAAESTLQQLIQVAGRAGRERMESMVIVQTCADHPIFSYLSETDYLSFYKQEIAAREMLGYPPIGFLFEIDISHVKEEVVQKEAELLVYQMRALLKDTSSQSIFILGPSRPPVHKIKSRYTQNIFLKGESFDQIMRLYKKAVEPRSWKASIYCTPSHLSL